jgi:hypothetical protein
LTFLLTLSWISISWAQKKKRWQIRPSLSFYEHYSDKIELNCDTCGDPVSGFKTQIIPGVTFLLPSKRRQIRIDYNMRMDYRTRSDNTNKALYWLDLDTYLGHELSPRTSYEMVFGYDITYTNPELGSPFADAFSAMSRANVLEFAPGIRYRLGKKTLTKGSLSYIDVSYASEDGVDSTEMSGAGYIERKFGTRVSINIGAVYTDKTFSNETGYTEMELPIGISLNLTYFKLAISTSYYTRTPEGDGEGLGEGSQILWGLGFDLGGKLFKLRKTTFKVDISSNIHDDMYGIAYIAQQIKIKAFHVLKKADVYNEIKYGQNSYIDVDDTVSYYGVALSAKWYMTKKKTLEGKLDYTDYTYEGTLTGSYTIITAELDYGHKLRDWLYIGVGIGRRQSSADTDDGSYAENYFGFFAKADW